MTRARRSRLLARAVIALVGLAVALAAEAGARGQVVPSGSGAEAGPTALRRAWLDAWHAEVVEGRFETAGEAYVRIYARDSGSSDPTEAAPYLAAAFRAGVAFEHAGNPRRAGLAYRWLVTRSERLSSRRRDGSSVVGDPADRIASWRDRAVLALRRIDPVDSSPPPAATLVAVVDDLERDLLGVRARVEALRQQVFELRRRGHAQEELVERWRQGGTILRPATWSEAAATAAVRALEAALGVAPDAEGFVEDLAELCAVEALREAEVGELAAARRAFALAGALAPWRPDVAAVARQVAEGRGADESAALAADRSRAEAAARRALVREDLRLRLSDARDLERPDRALRELERARRIVDGLRVAARRDPEIARLAERIEERSRIVAGPRLEKRLVGYAAAWNESWSEARVLALELLDRAFELELWRPAPRLDGERSWPLRERERLSAASPERPGATAADDAWLLERLEGWLATWAAESGGR